MAYFFLSAIAVVAGDFFAKYWSTNQKTIFFILSLSSYLLSGVFYIPTLLRDGLVITALIWSVLGTLGFLVVGLAVFHETLTPLQLVGVVFGAISLIILAVSFK